MINRSIKHFIDVGDSNAPAESPAWCRASHVELCAVKRRTDHEVRLLKYGLLEFKQKERWRLLYDNDDQPFQSWEDYIQYPEPNGLGMPAESVKAVLEELNDRALLGDVLLGKHGTNQHTLGVGSAKSSSSGGTTVPYILARLERDGHSELAAKVRFHEMSAQAAAVEVGYRKPITPFNQLKKLITKVLPRLSDDEIEELRRLLERSP